jgi:hypothetical protein
MYTVESILAQAMTGTIKDRNNKTLRGTRVHISGSEIMVLVVSDSEVYWSIQGTPVTVEWVARFLEHYQTTTGLVSRDTGEPYGVIPYPY